MGLLDQLSDQQLEAVQTIDDDLEIIACAGAGKTGVVTRRIINILKSKSEILPENIVAFTFTRKAAEELKGRIYDLGKRELGDTIGFAHMYIGTIHGFCIKMLQEYIPEFQKYDVLDEIHTKLFVERYYDECGMKDLDSQNSASDIITPDVITAVTEDIKHAADHIRNNHLPRKCSKEKCSRCHLNYLCLGKKEQKEYVNE